MVQLKISMLKIHAFKQSYTAERNICKYSTFGDEKKIGIRIDGINVWLLVILLQ